MWYYDEYMKNNNLIAKLFLCNTPKSISSQPFLTGILTSKLGFSVNHEWKDKQDVLSSILNLFAEIPKQILDFGEDMYKSALTKSQAFKNPAKNEAEVSSLAYNTLITANSNMFKMFAGTKINLQPPTMEVLLITETIEDDIISIVSDMFGDGNYNSPGLGGGFLMGPTSNVTTPPSKFRYTYTYNLNANQVGSYKLMTNKFIMTNLVLSSLNVEFSDSIAHTKKTRKQPLYAKLNLSFDWCVTQTQQSVVKFLLSRPNMEDGASAEIFQVPVWGKGTPGADVLTDQFRRGSGR